MRIENKYKKCVYCGKPVKARDYCNTCYAYLHRLKYPIDDKDLCNKVLRQHHSKVDKCLFCGRPTVTRYFCGACSKYLNAHKCSPRDVQKALAVLSNKKVLVKKCKFCGGNHKLAKGYCDKHYNYLRRRGMDFTNDEECIRVLSEYYDREA